MDPKALYVQSCFTSKTRGKHKGKALEELPNSSGNSAADGWWKLLRKMEISSKIKLFIWRACNGWIPTMGNLAGGRISVEPFSPLCKRKSLGLKVVQLRDNHAPVTVAWEPPLCFYKISTDAAVDGACQVIGIGISIRDETGFVMTSSSQRINATFSPHVVEAVAVLVAKTDVQVVAKWIAEGTQLYSEVCLVITYILPLIQNMRSRLVSYVPRKANQVAHLLTRMAMALSNSEDLYWMAKSPQCVNWTVHADRPVNL
ncbi:hypothetical protein Ddye_016698 [Dipteronia dyeriana]|uniref:RNase H type-1 domain-containing protein n=1 Tax=Dipteronia dyeriana TaxID=168575 RepID=A0AAD9U7T8_9ROSI|nr:hypothetical protein Ddye_016698 [Dipteronia dyeriana]